jgi:serine/threonine-protein kinase
MQRYGMILADGGQIPLTATSDRFTEHKWSEVGVDAEALRTIAVTDMEVVGLGDALPNTGECARN